MARTSNITTPPGKTDDILRELKQVDELLELQVFRGTSVEPLADPVSLAVPNRQLNRVMRILDHFELGQEGGISLSTSAVEVTSRQDPGGTSNEITMRPPGKKWR